MGFELDFEIFKLQKKIFKTFRNFFRNLKIQNFNSKTFNELIDGLHESAVFL